MASKKKYQCITITVLVFITDILVGLYQRECFYTVHNIVGMDSSICIKFHNSGAQYEHEVSFCIDFWQVSHKYMYFELCIALCCVFRVK